MAKAKTSVTGKQVGIVKTAGKLAAVKGTNTQNPPSFKSGKGKPLGSTRKRP